MKKVIVPFFVLLSLFFVVSCNEKIDTATDQTINGITLTSNKEQNVFYINKENGSLSVAATFINEKGQKVPTTEKVEWTTNFEQKKTDPFVAIIGNTMTVDLDSIDVLDDFEITASWQNSEKKTLSNTYCFSLYSTDELKNSLVYSYMSQKALNSNVGDDGRISTLTIKEYDENDRRIVEASQRMIIGSDLTYYMNGSSALYITNKQNTKFGNLSVSNISSENAEAFEVVEGGFIIKTESIENETITFDVEAGTKDKRTLTIKTVAPEKKIPSPIVNETGTAGSDGKIVIYTGDNVSDDDGANSLEINVYRKKYENTDEILSVDNAGVHVSGKYGVYDYSSNNETAKLDSGVSIHLKHAGDYVIASRVVTASGTDNSEWQTKTVHIAPYVTANDTCYSKTDIEQIAEVTDTTYQWSVLDLGQSEAIRQNKTKIDVTNSTSGNRYVKVIYNSGDSLKDSYTSQTYRIPSTQKLSDVTPEYIFKYAGEYTVKIWTNDTAGGCGTILEEELEEPYMLIQTFSIGNKRFTAENYIDVTLSSLTANISAPADITENDVIYGWVYRPDGSDRLDAGKKFALTSSSPTTTFAIPDYKGYAIIYYAFNKGQNISSDVKIINVPALPLPANANPNVTVTNGLRKVTMRIINTTDSWGGYRTLYYAYSTSSASVPSSWTTLGTGATYTVEKTSEGTQYFWVKTVHTNKETSDADSVKSTAVTLVLNTNTASVSVNNSQDLQNAAGDYNKRVVRVTQSAYTGLDGAAHYRTMLINGSSVGQVASYDIVRTTEGSANYTITLNAADYLNEKGTTSQTVTVTLTRITAVPSTSANLRATRRNGWDGDWSYGQFYVKSSTFNGTYYDMGWQNWCRKKNDHGTTDSKTGTALGSVFASGSGLKDGWLHVATSPWVTSDDDTAWIRGYFRMKGFIDGAWSDYSHN